jgi:hypothetical protein
LFLCRFSFNRFRRQMRHLTMICGYNQTTTLKGSELQQQAEEYHPTWYSQE